jgi:hypothetical protein
MFPIDEMYYLLSQISFNNKCQNTNKERWIDASYDDSLFESLWTLCKVYSIQMPQTHCKIINLTKIFMD